MAKNNKNNKKKKSSKKTTKVEKQVTDNKAIEKSENNIQDEETNIDLIDNEPLPLIEEEHNDSNTKDERNSSSEISDIDTKEEKIEINNEIAKPLDKNRKNIYIAVGIALSIFALSFILLALPAIRYKNGVQKFADGEYEEAYILLNKVPNYKDSADFLEVIKLSLASEITNQIIEDEGKNNKQLKLQTIENIEINFTDVTKSMTFDVILANKKYELHESYSVNYEKSENGWTVSNYDTLSSEIIPLIKCDENLVNEEVQATYKGAELLEQSNVNSTNIKFKYLYENESQPLYMSTYNVYAIYSFDDYFGRWYFDSMRSELIGTKKIYDTKTFNTSFFDIDLPNNWTLNCEESDTYGGYFWYDSNKTPKYSYFSCLYINISHLSDFIKTSDYKETPDANSGLGYGKYEISSDSIYGYYYPLIEGEYYKLTIDAYDISEADFKQILNSLKIVRRKYNIKVSGTNVINIRDYCSTEIGTIVGKARKGETYTATAISVDDNYTWYMIGENQWIADDGTWLDVTFN